MSKSKISRRDFDAAIDTAKAGLRVDESGKTFSKVRGLGPSISAKELEDLGVDVKQLVAGKNQGNLGSAEEDSIEDRDAQSTLKKSGLEKTAKEKYAKGGAVKKKTKAKAKPQPFSVGGYAKKYGKK
jgi:hypothetical protein